MRLNSLNQNLLTETELSSFMKVSKKLLQKMRREGTGPRYLKIGRLVRYRQADVEEYIASTTFEFTQQEVRS